LFFKEEQLEVYFNIHIIGCTSGSQTVRRDAQGMPRITPWEAVKDKGEAEKKQLNNFFVNY
jgi:hypothetical protein